MDIGLGDEDRLKVREETIEGWVEAEGGGGVGGRNGGGIGFGGKERGLEKDGINLVNRVTCWQRYERRIEGNK